MVEVGCGALRSVSRGISGSSREVKSVGMGPEIGPDRSGCSKCNELRDLARAVLEELRRGRLDLAQERLLAIVEETSERVDEREASREVQ